MKLPTTAQGLDVAVACERHFQNGGPRVQVRVKNSGDLDRCTYSSVREALRYANAGTVVWARRKTRGGPYIWHCQEVVS